MSSIGNNAGRNVFQQSLASMAKQAATAAAKGADKGAPKSKAISRKQGVARHLATQAGKAAVQGAAEGATKRTDPVVRFANGAVDTVGVANGVDTVLGAGAKAIKDLKDGARLPWAVSKTTAPADGILQTSKLGWVGKAGSVVSKALSFVSIGTNGFTIGSKVAEMQNLAKRGAPAAEYVMPGAETASATAGVVGGFLALSKTNPVTAAVTSAWSAGWSIGRMLDDKFGLSSWGADKMAGDLDKKTSIGYISDRAKELSSLTKGHISRGLVTPEQRANAKYVVRQLAELKLLGLDGADRGKVAERLRGVDRNLVLMNRSPILDGFDKAMMINDYLNNDTTSEREKAVQVAPTEPPLMTR